MPKRVFLRLVVASFLLMSSAHATSACNLTALPLELQQRLKTEFSSWKIQDAGDLKGNAKDRWQSEKLCRVRVSPSANLKARRAFLTHSYSFY